MGVGGAFVGGVGDDADGLLVGYVEAVFLSVFLLVKTKGKGKGERGGRGVERKGKEGKGGKKEK